MKRFGLLLLGGAAFSGLFACPTSVEVLSDLCDELGFAECGFVEALDGALRIGPDQLGPVHGHFVGGQGPPQIGLDQVLDLFAVVTLTELPGSISDGLFGFADGSPVFELTRGSAFVTTRNSLTRQRILLFLFQTKHVLIGTEGTSFFAEIDPSDRDAVSWTLFDGSGFLVRRDGTAWPDGSMEVLVEEGRTFKTIGNNQPVSLSDKGNEERNQILGQVNNAAFEEDPRLVPFVDGMTLRQATQLIADAGLVTRPVDLDDDDVVESSDPPGGKAVSSGTEVQLLGQ